MENKEEFTLYHMKKKQAGDPSIRKLPTFDMDTCITEYIRKENIDLTDDNLEKVRIMCRKYFWDEPGRWTDEEYPRVFGNNAGKATGSSTKNKKAECSNSEIHVMIRLYMP